MNEITQRREIEMAEQNQRDNQTENKEIKELLRLKTGSVTIENGTVSVLYITSPNMSSDSSVN
jgi:hypothetical protein